MFSEWIFCHRNVEDIAKGFRWPGYVKRTVDKWYKQFQEVEEWVEDEQHTGRPWMSTDENHIKVVKDLMLKNRRLTIRDLAETVRISKGSVNTSLKDVLWLRRVKSILVPKTLNLFVTIWPKIRPISFHNHRIRLIWHHVISGYSINSKNRSGDTVSSPLKIFNLNRCAVKAIPGKNYSDCYEI